MTVPMVMPGQTAKVGPSAAATRPAQGGVAPREGRRAWGTPWVEGLGGEEGQAAGGARPRRRAGRPRWRRRARGAGRGRGRRRARRWFAQRLATAAPRSSRSSTRRGGGAARVDGAGPERLVDGLRDDHRGLAGAQAGADGAGAAVVDGRRDALEQPVVRDVARRRACRRRARSAGRRSTPRTPALRSAATTRAPHARSRAACCRSRRRRAARRSRGSAAAPGPASSPGAGGRNQ